MTQAFEGVRILDFTQVFSGPFAVTQLALLGADVIKVEQPGTGDQTRGFMNKGKDAGMSASFMAMNQNKQSLTLNLKEAAAVEVIHKILPTIDVVVENFKAGTMARMGLDFESLKKIEPDLIYCSITGYGQNGPKAGEAAYDGAIQAASGMMSQNGHPETGPTRTGFMPVDMSTALHSSFALAAAIHRKSRTGEGQFIDMAMMDTAMLIQAAQFSNYINQGSLIGLQGNSSPTGQPTADVFPTEDGFIQITALRQPQVEKLFAALELSEMLQQPEFVDPSARYKNPELVHQTVAAATAKKTTAQWMAILAPAGVPVALIQDIPDVLDDPQLEVRDVFAEFESPIEPGTNARVIKAGFNTDVDGPTLRTAPPALGEHTDEILFALGYDLNQIDDMRNAGTI